MLYKHIYNHMTEDDTCLIEQIEIWAASSNFADYYLRDLIKHRKATGQNIDFRNMRYIGEAK